MFHLKKYLLLSAVLAATLTACGTVNYTESEKDLLNTLDGAQFQPADRTLRDNITTQDLFAQAAFWSKEYTLNPGDLEASIKLAAAVRKMGNPARAVEITQTSRALYPRDPYLNAEHAAALIMIGRLDAAHEVLDETIPLARGYARLWSLKGVAFDQEEQYDQARKYYQQALRITPQDPSILANLGLNYALSGDPKQAEYYLQAAANLPGAGKDIRQNLDVIRQLQGKPTLLSGQRSAETAAFPSPQSHLSHAQGRIHAPQTRQQATQPQSSFAPQAQPRQTQPALRGSSASQSHFATTGQNSHLRPQSQLTSQIQRQSPHLNSRGSAQPPQPGISLRPQLQSESNAPKTALEVAQRIQANANRQAGNGNTASIQAQPQTQAQNQDILNRIAQSVQPGRQSTPQASIQINRLANDGNRANTQPARGYPAPNYAYPTQVNPAYNTPAHQGVAPQAQPSQPNARRIPLRRRG